SALAIELRRAGRCIRVVHLVAVGIEDGVHAERLVTIPVVRRLANVSCRVDEVEVVVWRTTSYGDGDRTCQQYELDSQDQIARLHGVTPSFVAWHHCSRQASFDARARVRRNVWPHEQIADQVSPRPMATRVGWTSSCRYDVAGTAASRRVARPRPER